MSEPTATELRQQYRSKLEDGITQGRELLERYQAAYPDLSQIDWLGVQSALAPNPMYGVNIHGRPTDLSPAWIHEQTIEPVEFGSMADPVSQLAFLAAPALLRGGKAALETMGSPGPTRLTALAGERGNLGPVPRGMRGEPLPESAVRGPQGELKRLYHGTRREYADFATEQFGTGAGGDLYGPGIYMTESPEIATAYSEAGGSRPVQLTRLSDLEAYFQPGRVVPSYGGQDKVLAFEPRGGDWRVAVQAVDRYGEPLPGQRPRWHQTPPEVPAAPNVRPVYADLKRPFDIEAGFDAEEISRITGVTPRPEDISASGWRGEGVYKILEAKLGGKDAANRRLAELGYDGITHIGGAVTGGQPHRVYIAFSPDTVYPSVNVEGVP